MIPEINGTPQPLECVVLVPQKRIDEGRTGSTSLDAVGSALHLVNHRICGSTILCQSIRNAEGVEGCIGVGMDLRELVCTDQGLIMATAEGVAEGKNLECVGAVGVQF